MKSQCELGVSYRYELGLPKIYEIGFIGILEARKNGKVLWREKNVITSDFLKESAKGAAIGSFNAVDEVKLIWSGGSDIEIPTVEAGGTGGVDYVTYNVIWLNDTGSSKTITDLAIGYNIDSDGKTYATKTGLTDIVAADEEIEYSWQLQFTYVSGGVLAKYRYNIAKMVKDGTFDIPNKTDFIETPEKHNCVTAVLNAGGDGVQTYHEWKGQFTAEGSLTIDIVKNGNGASCPPETIYSSDDVANKSMVDEEMLSVYTRYNHSAT